MGPRRLNALLLAAALTSCAGPRVRVGPAEVGAAPTGQVRVEATLDNRGGAGEVKVIARVRDRRTGKVYAAERSVDLRAREALDVVVDVPAPAGDYAAIMTAGYPPE